MISGGLNTLNIFYILNKIFNLKGTSFNFGALSELDPGIEKMDGQWIFKTTYTKEILEYC